MAHECDGDCANGVDIKPTKPGGSCSSQDGRAVPTTATFWSRVDTSGGSGGCWLWTGYRNRRDGYGRLMVGRRSDGPRRNRLAHVVAYELACGPVPQGLELRHLCGNGRLGCVRPDHMVPGTHQENVADTVAMGRTTRGERNPNAKLTAESVTAMRLMRLEGRTVAELAEEFGVTTSLVSQVTTGRTWRHVAMPCPTEARRSYQRSIRAEVAAESTAELVAGMGAGR